MKNGALLFLLISVFACNSQPKPPVSGADSTTMLPAAENSRANKENYFVLLAGTIDTYSVTMYLFALNHSYSGYYYYDSKQQPIYFVGEDSSVKDRIILHTLADSADMEMFTFSFDGNKAAGNWIMGGKSLPLSLSETMLPVTFAYIGWKDSTNASKTLPNSPKATSELSSVWPRGNSATDEFIKMQIAKLFNDKSGSKDISTILANSGKGFLDDYRSDTTVNDRNVSDNPERFNFESSADLRIAYQSPKLLSLSLQSYSYTGGAHGNYGTTFLPLDMADNKVLSLTDILTPDGIRQLRPLLESSFRKDRKLTPKQPLTDGGIFDNKIEANKNFYVTGKGLLFDYNPYEIASYADGEITIMIGYSSLQPYLQASFKSLLLQ